MGFLAFIKNGTKGTYGLQMPAFFPASRVTYDGGTVEDALDEVANRGTVVQLAKQETADTATVFTLSNGHTFSEFSYVIMVTTTTQETTASNMMPVSLFVSYNNLNVDFEDKNKGGRIGCTAIYQNDTQVSIMGYTSGYTFKNTTLYGIY